MVRLGGASLVHAGPLRRLSRDTEALDLPTICLTWVKADLLRLFHHCTTDTAPSPSWRYTFSEDTATSSCCTNFISLAWHPLQHLTQDIEMFYFGHGTWCWCVPRWWLSIPQRWWDNLWSKGSNLLSFTANQIHNLCSLQIYLVMMFEIWFNRRKDLDDHLTSLMRTWHSWGEINIQLNQIFQVCISCFLKNFNYLKLKWHWMTSLHFFKTPHDQVEAVPVSTQTHLQRRGLTQFKVPWKKEAKIPMKINVQKKSTNAWQFILSIHQKTIAALQELFPWSLFGKAMVPASNGSP